MQEYAETIYINGCTVKIEFAENPQTTVLSSIESILLNQLPTSKKRPEICENSGNMV